MEYGKFIEIERKDAESFMFICKAVSDDSTRYFMNYIFCTEDKLISTDGRRLHILELGDNPYGFNGETFYKVLKMNTKTVWIAEITSDVGKFPNHKRVMPEGKHTTTTQFQLASGYRYLNSNFVGIANLIRKLPTVNAISLQYLEDLKKNIDWKVQIYGEDKAVKFTAGNLTAVIMLMHVD